MSEQPKNEALPPDKTEGAHDLPESSESARPLTPEEQMAAFEKELKESDWGHQPC
jgi:hypothetical protein